MVIEIDIRSVIEIVFIVLSLKLILSRWYPPVQESIQAIISIVLGSCIGYFINPTKDGIVLAIVVSCISFYGKDLIVEFTDLKNDLKDADINIENKTRRR